MGVGCVLTQRQVAILPAGLVHERARQHQRRQHGPQNVDQTHVAETYYRMAVSEFFTVTADLQYMKDVNRAGSDPEGIIFGIRLTAEFQRGASATGP